jgi:hypothetical protein
MTHFPSLGLRFLICKGELMTVPEAWGKGEEAEAAVHTSVPPHPQTST